MVYEATHEGQRIRPWDLLPDHRIRAIRKQEFIDCHILGPAILMPLGQMGAEDCLYRGGQEVDALLWPVPLTRDKVVGTILVENCRFVRCLFDSIGFTVSESRLVQFREQMRPYYVPVAPRPRPAGPLPVMARCPSCENLFATTVSVAPGAGSVQVAGGSIECPECSRDVAIVEGIYTFESVFRELVDEATVLEVAKLEMALAALPADVTSGQLAATLEETEGPWGRLIEYVKAGSGPEAVVYLAFLLDLLRAIMGH